MHTHLRLLSPSLMLAAVIGAAGVHLRAELPVPDLADLTRVDRYTQPGPQDAITATYILRTWPHPTLGDAYVIVTDHDDPSYIEPLGRLAAYHHGSIIHVSDLGILRSSSEARNLLSAQILLRHPRFVAIAPRVGSFTENMLLGAWRVLGELGDDHQLPVMPGILAAPDATAFRSLIEGSIAYRPQSISNIRPFVMAQVLGPRPFGMRSLQKVRIMEALFARYNRPVNSLVVLANSAVRLGVRIDPKAGQWEVEESAVGPVQAIPREARQALDQATLLILFGHGSPGTECSVSVDAFQDVPMSGKIVMSGDCYSSAPILSTDGAAGLAPDGPGPIDPNSFAMRAVKNGALVVYAHMHENQGFPPLYPVLANYFEGLTVGEAYQRQVNANLSLRKNSFQKLAVPEGDNPQRPGDDSDSLLYTIIGDPALQPFEKDPQRPVPPSQILHATN